MGVAGVESVGVVGRGPELAALRAALDEAREGRGGIAMLIGEAGIGKTRVAEELMALARASGASVANGSCYEDDAAASFGPWTQVASQVVSTLGRDQLSDRLGAGAAALAEVVPAVRWALPDREQPAVLSPEETRLRVYEAFAGLLLTAPDEPLVVVLEDLHWADAASLDLLRHLARGFATARLLVVATYRAEELELAHPLARTIGAIERFVHPIRLRLGPLGREDTAALVEALAGGPVGARLRDAIRRETGGNPFFVTEVVRHLREQGRDLAAGDLTPEELGIPEGVRAALASRLARLSPDTVRVLSVVSAFAGPFEFAVLGPLLGLPDDLLLDCVDEALRARMINAVGTEERYEFAHALVRHALYDDLSPSRKARLHRRIAEALEGLPGNEHDRAAELAVQYLLSSSLPGAAHGIPHALAAAESARRAYAYERAVRFLRIARDLAADGAPSVRAEILAALAIAEAEALMLASALESVEEAVAALHEAGAAPEAIAGFLVKATWALQEGGAEQTLIDELAERGRSLLGTTRDLTWARLKLTATPLEEIPVGTYTAGRWLGFDPEAVDIARARGDERDWAKTLELMDWRSRTDVDELRARVERWQEPRAAIHGLGVVMRSLMFQHGAFVDAAAAADQLFRRSSRFGSLPGQAYALVYLAWTAHVRGDEDEASATGEEATELVFRLGEAHRLRYSLLFLAMVDPDWPSIADEREAAAADPRLPSWMTLLYLSQAASAHARAGAREAARRRLDELVPVLARMPPTTLNQNGAVANAATAAWELGESAHAGPLRELALGLVDGGVGDYPGESTELAVARMAALLGDSAEAASHFTAARSTVAASGQRPLLEVVDADERQAASTGRSRQRFPAGLTGREAEVLRLLARGRSNREIAADLVLSVHTVERHIANAYRKVGVHNRAEATAFVLRVSL
jgi:DNA-binding CsgD family transcriptional regulator